MAIQEFDPFDVHTDPVPYYGALRDSAPIHYVEHRGTWVVSRFADVQQAARDWESFAIYDFFFGPGALVHFDRPQHPLFRKVLHERFTPKAIAELEPVVRRHVRELLDELPSSGTVDLAAGFTSRLPIRVAADVLGLDADDADAFGSLVGAVADWSSPDVGPDGRLRAPDAATDALERLRETMARYLESDGPIPQPGTVLDAVVAAARTSDAGLASAGLVNLVSHVGAALVDTTASLLSSLFRLLAEHPDERRLLIDGAVGHEQAVEETLRLAPPLPVLRRRTTRPVRIADTDVPEGSTVMLLSAAANRDDRRWERPDEFSIARSPQRNLGFGEGIHHCLGAPLARLEARVALEELLARYPQYEIAGPMTHLYTFGFVRGTATLPIALRGDQSAPSG